MQDLLYANQVLFTRGHDGSTNISPLIAVRNATTVLVRPGASAWWARNSEMFQPAFSQAVSESVAKARVEGGATNATQGST